MIEEPFVINPALIDPNPKPVPHWKIHKSEKLGTDKVTEREFRDKVRAGTEKLGIAWELIENTSTPGHPDAIAHFEGTSAEVEFKICPGNLLCFETFQIAWLIRAASGDSRAKILGLKGDTLLLWRCGALPKLIKYGIAKVRGIQREKLFTATRRMQVFNNESAIFKSSAPFDWEGLKAVLFS